MDRSSRQGLRAERISNSPYKRPESSGLKKSSSTTFSTVKNMFSYALSPLFRSSSSSNLRLPSTTADLPKQIEEKSESGSEDGWNGTPPNHNKEDGQADDETPADVFDLAAAAGRSGKAFEARAALWRSKEETIDEKRNLDRRNLEGIPPATAPAGPSGTTTEVNGFSNKSGALNAFSSSYTRKRPLSPALTTPARPANGLQATPTPSFLPPAATPGSTSNYASSAALATFLEAKKGATLTLADLQVIDSLTNNLHAEVGTPQKSITNTQFGGWSAGMSPRVTKPLPHSHDSPATPARPVSETPLNTPGSTFSIGSGTPLRSASRPNPVRYFGPGMSPRRMLGKQRSGGLRPLFQFTLPTENDDESAKKKRKVEEDDVETSETNVFEKDRPKTSLAQSVSLPNLSSVANTPQRNGKVDSRPHPLSQSIVPAQEAQPDFVAKGKKRAADIMRELIEEQIAPVEAAKATGALTQDIVINPYDSPSSRISTPAETRVYDSPRKSVLRASVRDTPKRGAAAKIELHKSTNGHGSSPLKSSLSSGRTESNNAKEKQAASHASETDKDQMEVNALFEDDEGSEAGSSAPTPAPAPAPSRKPQEIKEPEPFKPYGVPVIDSPSRPIPSFAMPAVSKFSASSSTSSFDFSPKKTVDVPKFTLPAPEPVSSTEDEVIEASSSKKSEPAKREEVDPTKIWLSAKNTALAVAKEALPFFTFDAVTTNKKDEKSTDAKQAAMNASVPTFVFTLPSAKPTSAATTPAFQWPSNGASAGQWTCDTCFLKSPDSAQKCTVCEAPRPGLTSSASTASTSAAKPATPASAPFQWPSGNAPQTPKDQWKCTVCDCVSPLTAPKCVACENPRPASAAPAAPSPAVSQQKPLEPAHTPFRWPEGSAPKVASDEWTCSICMIRNKAAATKCAACETPK